MLKVFYSRTISTFAFAFLTILLLLSTFFPEGEFFSTSWLLSSYLFRVLSFYILISLILCSVQRIFLKETEAPSKLEEEIMTPQPTLFLDNVEHSFSSILWRKKREKNKLVIIHRWNKFFSILFHTSMVGVVLLGMVNALLSFKGEMILGEGEEKVLDEKEFVAIYRRPVKKVRFPHIRLRFDRFISHYEKGIFPVEFVLFLTFLKGEREETKEILINKPVKEGDWKFLLSKYGYAPVIVIREKGKVLFKGAINLMGLSPDFVDGFKVPGTSLYLDLRFYPNLLISKGSPISIGMEPLNPAYEITVYKKGRLLGQSLVRKGERVRIGSYSLEFVDIKRWVSLLISSSYMEREIIVSMLLCAVFLTGALVFDRKAILLKAEDKSVLWNCKSRVNPYSFKMNTRKKFDKILKNASH